VQIGIGVSLTRAQQIVSGPDYAVAPGRHWSFNEVLISTLYEAIYPATISDD